MIKKSKELYISLRQKQKLWEIIVYTFFGGLTTIVGFGSLLGFYYLAGMDENSANFAANAVAVLFAYAVNKIWVFCSRCSGLRELAREFLSFISARIASILFDMLGIYVLVTVMNLQIFWSKLAITVFVVIINYFLSKFFIFKKKKGT